MHTCRSHGYKLIKTSIDLHVQILFMIHMDRKMIANLFVCAGTKEKTKMEEKDKGRYVLGQKENSQIFETNTWEKEVLQEKKATCTT